MRVGWSKMEIFARYIFRTFTSKATFIILYYVAEMLKHGKVTVAEQLVELFNMI